MSLHFTKDYQIRNFYNSSVLLNELDLSNDVLDESVSPAVHFTSPGCAFNQIGQVLEIYNNSGSEQESYVNLGNLHNYAAIDMDIKEQSHSSGTASALLSLFKDKDNRFVIAQRSIDAGDKQITLEIFKNSSIVFSCTLLQKGISAYSTHLFRMR